MVTYQFGRDEWIHVNEPREMNSSRHRGERVGRLCFMKHHRQWPLLSWNRGHLMRLCRILAGRVATTTRVLMHFIDPLSSRSCRRRTGRSHWSVSHHVLLILPLPVAEIDGRVNRAVKICMTRGKRLATSFVIWGCRGYSMIEGGLSVHRGDVGDGWSKRNNRWTQAKELWERSVKEKCSDQKRTRVPCGIDDHACTQKGRISPWCNGNLWKELNYPGWL